MNVIAEDRKSPLDRRADIVRDATIPAAEVALDVGALARTVWRGKLLVAVIAAAFGLLSMVAVYSVTPRYQADAVVMLDRDQEQFIDIQSVVSGMSADYFSIIAEPEVLRSRKLAGRVVDKLALTEHPLFNPDLQEASAPPPPLAWITAAIELLKGTVRGAVREGEAPGRELLEPEYFLRQTAIDRLLARQTVTSIENTYVYRIMIETPDPLLSAEIANAMADAYITDQLEKKFEATEAATIWLTDRVVTLEAELEQAEGRVEAYNASASLISESALAAQNRQLKELRERRADLRASRGETEARRAALEAAIARGDAEAAGAIAGPQLADAVRTLETPGVRGETQEQAERRLELFAQRALASLEVEAERAERQYDALGVSIEQLETQLAAQTADLVQLRQLQREAEASRRIYEQFLRRLNETSVQQGVQQPDARVLSPAVVDFVPSFPNKTLTVLAAIIFGGLVGMVLVIVLEQTNRSFRSAEELERETGIGVLGTIPAAPVRSRRDLIGYARKRASSQLMEAVRNMRTGVLLANMDRPPKVVMLTSSLPKEGKTTSSLLLAQNAAALGRKVLLIECDLRRRTFRTYFEVKGESGLISILTGEKTLEEVVHHDPESGLDVIPGEATKVNAADVFSSKRFADFVAEMRETYDFVVIDTPPVLAVPDARVIAPLVDAVLYCVRWNSTHKDLVRNGIASFTQINVRVTGLALTQVNLRKQARYGYGGYNYYYYKTSRRYYTN